jgi:hypothetical protein
MNSIALRYAVAVLAVVLLCMILASVLSKSRLERVKATVAWLLKVSFLDFVEMVIFIRSWKAYVEQIGILIWLVLVYAISRYMIAETPEITEIPGVYIPVIGYVYFVSVLVIMKVVLGVIRKEN